MKRIVSAAPTVFGWLVLMTGCATVPQERGVAVSLLSVRPLQSSLFETTAELTLRFVNESSRPIVLTDSTHQLYINGTRVGRASTHERLTIPQLGTMTQTMTAHLGNLALMRTSQELGDVTIVDYRIDSRLHAAEESGGGTLGATATGKLDLSGLLPAAPGSGLQ